MQDKLTLTFAALSDPTRRAILAKLSRGEATVKELAKPFDMSPPAITKHLNVLEKAGLISRGKNAQFRPCRIEADNLRVAADWISEYRKFWEESFDRLDAYLKTMTEKKKMTKRKAKKNGNHQK
jgi:DNA-binding transcriptional ArsR family regulator